MVRCPLKKVNLRIPVGTMTLPQVIMDYNCTLVSEWMIIFLELYRRVVVMATTPPPLPVITAKLLVLVVESHSLLPSMSMNHTRLSPVFISSNDEVTHCT